MLKSYNKFIRMEEITWRLCNLSSMKWFLLFIDLKYINDVYRTFSKTWELIKKTSENRTRNCRTRAGVQSYVHARQIVFSDICTPDNARHPDTILPGTIMTRPTADLLFRSQFSHSRYTFDEMNLWARLYQTILSSDN